MGRMRWEGTDGADGKDRGGKGRWDG